MMNHQSMFAGIIGMLVISLALLATPVAALNMTPLYHPDPVTKQVYPLDPVTKQVHEEITSVRPSVDVINNARYLRGSTSLPPGRWFFGSCR
jgi:hypothetical protein